MRLKKDKIKEEKIRWIIGIIITIFIALIGWTFFNNNINVNNQESYQSPTFINSDNNSVSYNNYKMNYKQISGINFSGKNGAQNRTVYLPNAKEVYYSGNKLLIGEQWINEGEYVKLYLPLWNEQIIEIGY